jgi:hypothetical protein
MNESISKHQNVGILKSGSDRKLFVEEIAKVARIQNPVARIMRTIHSGF